MNLATSIWIMFGATFACIGIIIYIFRQELMKAFGVYLQHKELPGQPDHLPSLEFLKTWEINDGVIGTVQFKTSAESSKEARANMDYLIQRSNEHDKQCETPKKEYTNKAIG